MRIKFWGTRGSIARPGPSTITYGGNTSCVEVVSAAGTRIVLDCGTGAYLLGQEIAAEGPSVGHLLIGHTHWDHVQGFPFFKPLFVAGSTWHIYAPGGRGKMLEETLAGQMTYEYFPIDLGSLDAGVEFHDLNEGVFDIDDVRVHAEYLNHPGVTLGYRLEVGGRTVVYSSDHEPHSEKPAELATVHGEDLRHIEFLRGADLVIHDTQYTEEEYQRDHVGWGHTPAERAVRWALAADVRSLALYHHDPSRTDEQVDEIAETCRELVPAESGLEVFAAAEGQVIELEELDVALGPAGDDARNANRAPRPRGKVLLVDDEPELLMIMRATLELDGHEIITAETGRDAIELARSEHPDLILLDLVLPDIDGLEVCRTLRAGPWDGRVPIVLVSGLRKKDEDIRAGFEAGVSDYLVKPFKGTYLRTRVHRWLSRGKNGPLRTGPA